MRRIIQIVSVSLSVALLATGCDFFRTLAGRPTSRDIAEKKALVEEAEAAIEAAQAPADTVAVQTADTVAARPAATFVPGQDAPKAGKKRFYVIMGAFSNPDNAARCAAGLKERGYETEFFGFTEGRTAVGIGGTDDAQEIKSFFDEIRRQDFCPSGVWILDRKRK